MPKPKSGEFAVLKRLFPPLRWQAEGEKLTRLWLELVPNP